MPTTNKLTTFVLLACVLASACRGKSAPAQQVPAALVAAVDSILPKLEILSGLKKLRPVELVPQSRAELGKYVETRLAKEMPPQELSGIHQTYVALGLVPDTLDIRRLLLDLYQEQVAGYYDPDTDKFYLVEGTPVEMLRPVLAHELVHALQDQHMDLDSLISRKRGNDRQTAAQAAIEGHATLVMFAFLAQEASGRPIVPDALPDVGEQLKPALDLQNSQFPVFKRAPRIIRETMVFPYISGAIFAQQVWEARTNADFPAPLGSMLPQSTEQVIHAPERFLTNRDAPTELRFANTKDVIYENTLGELETGILLSVYLGVDPEVAASGWDGDRYQLINSGGHKVLVWQSVWDDAAAADRFMKTYSAVSRKRTDRTIRVERNTVQGREGVLIFDAVKGVAVATMKPPAVRILP